QTAALHYKCIRIFLRTWRSTLVRALLLPVIFIIVMGYVKNLYVPGGEYGIGTPQQVRQLADAIGSRTLVYLADSDDGVTAEIRAFMANVTAGIPDDQIDELEDATDLLTACRQNLRGASSCYGAIVWHSFDSAKSTYNYTLRADRGLDKVDVKNHDSDAEVYIMPLQWAVDAALSGRDPVADAPYLIAYTSRTKEEHEDDIRANYMKAVENYLASVFYLAMVGVIYQLAGHVGAEREYGIATLLESMGCRRASRHLAFTIAYFFAYLPGWIIIGIVMRFTMFKETSLGILIVYHILNGLATICFALALAQALPTAQLAGIIATGISVFLAIMAIIQKSVGPHNGATSGVLGFIFPPMNYAFNLQEVARYEASLQAANLLHVPPDGYVAPGIFWIGTVIQIPLYLLLASGIERALYGRIARATTNSDANYELTLTNVSKTYYPFTFLGIFSRAKKATPVEAVKDLSVGFRDGEISCLLGANGSGKTTTLEMIAGIQNVTSGKIQFSSDSTLGICPQKNVMWDILTVEEHIRIFCRIKRAASNSSADINTEVEQLIEACDLSPKRKFYSRNLSGGQKRKLQLAMMFVGGSKVCCIDEVSSGLDPLSRRKIWDILLNSRGERTIILTTHFLDEADLLADNIVLMARGELQAHGSPVELKEAFGNGYRVSMIVGASGKEITYDMPTAQQAIDLAKRLALQYNSTDDLRIAGPQLEDVFLKFVAASDPEVRELLGENSVNVEDDSVYEHEKSEKEAATAFLAAVPTANSDFKLHKGHATSIWTQIRTMIWKRLVVSKRMFLPIVTVFILPIIVSGATSSLLSDFRASSCVGTSAASKLIIEQLN
ncbi:uncharacterized protein V1518DRAFT_445255, partial [Limtongia smithiae]|uniref:uncharacterized protein n=1 Tax=Limtongia smithiae TaxID=1125753 RepID=UPI0034CD3D3E